MAKSKSGLAERKGKAVPNRELTNEKNEDERKRVLAMEDSKQAMYLIKKYDAKHGDPIYDEMLEAFNDDRISEKVNEYFDLMAKNGDPTPMNSVDKAPDLGELVSKNGGDWTAARKEMLAKLTGLQGKELDETYEVLRKWTGGSSAVNLETLEKFVSRSPALNQKIYRGLHFEPGDGNFDKFVNGLHRGGDFSLNVASSWSTDRETARQFAHLGDGTYDSVLVKCVGNRTGVPLDYMNSMGESEVLTGRSAKYTVLNVETYESSQGGRKAVITVVEKGR